MRDATTDRTASTGTDHTDDEGRAFKNDRLRNAYYWAAQLRGLMESITAGYDGEWYVEVLAGQAVLVLSDEFDVGGVTAAWERMDAHNFPGHDAHRRPFIQRGGEYRLQDRPGDDHLRTVRDLRDTDSPRDAFRIFVTPTDDRLLSRFVTNWTAFESAHDYDDSGKEVGDTDR